MNRDLNGNVKAHSHNIMLIADLSLLLIALMWGLAFSVIKILLSIYPTWWLLCLRFAAGAMLVFAFFHKRILYSLRHGAHELLGGTVIGVALFVAMGLQTFGLLTISAGQSAFLTAIYVLLVPLILWGARGVFPGWITLFAALVCVTGMALLTGFNGDISNFATGDILTILSAVAFALQVFAIGHYTENLDPFVLAFVQFVVFSLLAAPTALFVHGPLVPTLDGVWQFAYITVCCTFLGFGGQVVAQKYTHASHAALIMSLESVFGLLGGVIFLDEAVSLKMFVGCALIFASVILAELEPFLHLQHKL